jgi:predicted DCC family thiol-disulfide oxidoreductase YuxK
MLTIAYDGQCVICRSTRRFAMALDWRRQLRWVDIHDAQAVAAHYPDLDFAQAMGQVHVRETAGREYTGFFGTRRMMRSLPALLPLGLALHLPGMTWLGQRAYRFIARHRYQINRLLGAPVCETDGCRVG